MPNTDYSERLVVTAVILIVIALLASGLIQSARTMQSKLTQAIEGSR